MPLLRVSVGANNGFVPFIITIKGTDGYLRQQLNWQSIVENIHEFSLQGTSTPHNTPFYNATPFGVGCEMTV